MNVLPPEKYPKKKNRKGSKKEDGAREGTAGSQGGTNWLMEENSMENEVTLRLGSSRCS